MASPIYVLVCKNDQPYVLAGKSFTDPGGPFVMEQYVRKADLESVKARIPLVSACGKARLAVLVFVDDQGDPL